MVTCARTRGSGMMVLPVTWATASMTWPISTSRKLGVMRWPLFWALTMPVAVNASTAATTAARKFDRVITLNTRAPGPALHDLLFICSSASLVPGVGFGRRLVRRDHAIWGTPQLLGFGGDLRNVQYQFLLTPVAGHADPCVGRGVQGGEDFLGTILVVQRR